MDRFEDMRVFVRVVEAGGISRAADQLNIAKSAVSRRIGDMEHRLGAQLFNRTTRKITLTETGTAFYERSRTILDDLEEAEQAVAEGQGAVKGLLKITMPLAFGQLHMRDVILEFRERWPEVTFDIDMNDRRVDIVEEGFDLAIRIGKLDDSAMLARRLAPARGMTLASPGFIEEYGMPDHPDALAHMPCLTYRNLKDPSRWTFCREDKSEFTVRVQESMSVSDGIFVKMAAIKGVGIARLPSFLCWDAVHAGDLVPILDKWNTHVGEIHAVYPPTRRLSRRVRVFVDFLAEKFGDAPYWER